MEDSTEYYIYRLSFKSYLSAMTGKVDDDVLKHIKEYILQHLADITFKDGNGEATTAFGSANFGQMGYVTIERRKQHILDKPNCKEQTAIDDFPDFNLVIDARKSLSHGIILAIEHRRKCFDNIDTVRKGLEKYFTHAIGRQFSVDVELRQISSSDKFWKHLEYRIAGGAELAALQLEVNNVDKGELTDGMTAQQAVFYSALLTMMTDVGVNDGKLSFQAHKNQVLNLERAKRNLGVIVALSCKKGFVVKARLKSERGWIRSDETAPVCYRLEKSMVLRPEDADEGKEAIDKLQFETLTRWFDNIYSDLEKIEREKEDEETRRTATR